MNLYDLYDLIDQLTAIADSAEEANAAEEPKVRLASQPHWPLASTLQGVVLREGTVWLLEGSSQGYAERSLWEG